MPRDRWDDSEAGGRGYDPSDRYERGEGVRGSRDGGWRGAPRIGPTGMTYEGQAGDPGTSGSYYEDERGRASYGGFSGGAPGYGPQPSRRPERLRDAYPDPGRRADYRADERLSPEEEEAIGGPYTDYGR